MFSLSIFNKSYFALAILVSLLSTICLSCHSNNKLPELIIKDDFSGKIDLGQVDIIGPFYFDKNKTDEYKSIDQDDLSYFGLKENELDEKKIENINYTSAKNTSFLSPGFENKILDIPAEYIDFWNLTDTNKTAKKMSNYYLACNIVSGKERNVLFLASACFGIKVWLNNRFIQEESYHTGYPKGFDYYIKLPLRKGKNLFVLKTNRGADQYCWRLSSKIADLASSQKEYSIDYFQHFIMNPIVYGKQVLKIYVGQYLSGNSITVCIKDRDNHVIKDSLRQLVDFNGNSFLNLEKLPDGLYTCTLKLPFGSFDEVFYNGDFRHLEDGINRKIASLKNLKVEDAKSLEAANNKMDTLFSQSVKSRSEGDIKFNEKNVVLLALSIQHILDRLPDHSLNLYDRSDGTYFKAYKSNLDDTYQYYMFHASKKVASDKELPVVFVMPYFQNPIDPAMNSWYYNNTDQLEWEKRLADSAGFALVWPYLRGNSATSAIGVADFFEVFNDVKKNHRLDANRIFLMGDCAGASRVIMLASKFPDLFAGLSLFQPETEMPNDTIGTPINFVPNLYNLPIYIYHSTKDEIIPVRNSDDFIRAAKKYNFQPRYTRSQSESHYQLPKNCHAAIFSFFKDKIRKKHYDTVHYVTYQSRYNYAYWLKINDFKKIGRAEISGIVDKNLQAIHVSSTNVATYTIYLKQTSLNIKLPVSIYTNGLLSYKGVIKKDSVLIANNSTRKAKNNVMGDPVSQFFGERFVYIQPQNGDTLSTIMSSRWGNQVFFTLNLYKETEVPKLLDKYNLLLFGDRYSSPFMKALIEQLKNSAKLINSFTKYGDYASYCIISANPYNPKKKVLYFWSNVRDNFYLCDKNLIIEGKDQYYVWDNNGKILNHGNFN